MAADLDPLATGLLGWLLTLLAHSTLLLGAAWLVARLASRASSRVHEILWRGALVTSLLTATLPGLGLPAVVAQAEVVALPEEAPPADAAAAPASAGAALPSSAPTRLVLRIRLRAAPPPAWEPDAAAPAAAPRAAAAPDAAALATLAEGPWLRGLLLLWLLAVLLGLVRRQRAHAALRQVLSGRRPLGSGAWADELAALLPRRTVRLSASGRLTGPLTLGALRPEVCVPEQALATLTPGARTALLAHEAAHVARRDLAWKGLADLLVLLLPLQPLLRLARRRLTRLAEWNADAWAVQRTGDCLALASCLTEVAGWSVPAPRPRAAAALGLTAEPGLLGQRVARLLEGASPPGRLSCWAARTLVLALGAAALLAGPRVVPALAAPAVPAAEEARSVPSPAVEERVAPGAHQALAAGIVEVAAELDALAADVRSLTALVSARPDAARHAARLEQISQSLERVRAEHERLRRLFEGGMR